MLLGAVAALVVLVILALLDDTIHDDEYILKTYDYPILAKVPNLLGSSDKQYAYYYQRKKNVK
jgi:capsular polysaccharide biosynthesis protein